MLLLLRSLLDSYVEPPTPEPDETTYGGALRLKHLVSAHAYTLAAKVRTRAAGITAVGVNAAAAKAGIRGAHASARVGQTDTCVGARTRLRAVRAYATAHTGAGLGTARTRCIGVRTVHTSNKTGAGATSIVGTHGAQAVTLTERIMARSSRRAHKAVLA